MQTYKNLSSLMIKYHPTRNTNTLVFYLLQHCHVEVSCSGRRRRNRCYPLLLHLRSSGSLLVSRTTYWRRWRRMCKDARSHFRVEGHAVVLLLNLTTAPRRMHTTTVIRCRGGGVMINDKMVIEKKFIINLVLKNTLRKMTCDLYNLI